MGVGKDERVMQLTHMQNQVQWPLHGRKTIEIVIKGKVIQFLKLRWLGEPQNGLKWTFSTIE